MAPFNNTSKAPVERDLYISYTPSTSVLLDYSTEEVPRGNQQSTNHDLLLNRVYNIGDSVRVRPCWPCLVDDGLPSCNPRGRQCFGRSGQTYWQDMRQG